MRSCDVIVIGGGTNGLAAAARLAAKGRRNVLLEAAETPGGGAGTREFAPGYNAPALAHTTRGLDARVMAGMDLARHGLTFHPALATTVLGPEPLTVTRAATSGPDKDAFAALHAKLSDFARVLAPFRALTPPRLTTAPAMNGPSRPPWPWHPRPWPRRFSRIPADDPDQHRRRGRG